MQLHLGPGNHVISRPASDLFYYFILVGQLRIAIFVFGQKLAEIGPIRVLGDIHNYTMHMALEHQKLVFLFGLLIEKMRSVYSHNRLNISGLKYLISIG